MPKSRRHFLATTSLGLLGAVAALDSQAQTPDQTPAVPPPGTPPAFGTGPLVGPEVSPATFAEAEKLVQIDLTENERAVAAASWRASMAALYERRTGPRKISLEPSLSPATRWNPMLPGMKSIPERDQFIPSKADPGPVPSNPLTPKSLPRALTFSGFKIVPWNSARFCSSSLKGSLS